jgi:hypothetical protein
MAGELTAVAERWQDSLVVDGSSNGTSRNGTGAAGG